MAKAVDPVCGKEVDVSTSERSTYLGKTYYFCSHEDKTEFDRNPEAYVAKEIVAANSEVPPGILSSDKIIDELKSLMRQDYDAVLDYKDAAGHIDDKDIAVSLRQFADDHTRHVSELSDWIAKLGGIPPAPSRDIKGILIEGYSRLRGITGTRGILLALESEARMRVRSYSDALTMNLPQDIMSLLKKNYEDELHHLTCLQAALDTMVPAK